MTQVSVDQFKHISFWVQVHGLPPGLLLKPYGERLGQELARSMGDFLEFDPNNRRNYIRFRALLDISESLHRGKLLKLDRGREIWVSFHYERLAKFCFFCGHLDHIQKDCAMLIEELESGHKPILQYNDSIKTTGLAHVTAIEEVEGLGKHSTSQMIPKEMQARSGVYPMDSNTKRQKMINTNENNIINAAGYERKEADAKVNNTLANLSSHERKDADAKANNTLVNLSKSGTRTGKMNSPTQKTGRSSNEQLPVKKD